MKLVSVTAIDYNKNTVKHENIFLQKNISFSDLARCFFRKYPKIKLLCLIDKNEGIDYFYDVNELVSSRYPLNSSVRFSFLSNINKLFFGGCRKVISN